MARYRGPRLRIVRRLGDLPGLTQKKPRKSYPPGQHGPRRARRKVSEYGIRLEEKQKLRHHYGLTERQFLRYVLKARKVAGVTGTVLLQLLEARLDNIVFRLGMAPTIPAARQLVNHGHVTVNGQVVDIPSYACRPGDEIGVQARESSRKLVHANLEMGGQMVLPSHLTFDPETLRGKVLDVVRREEVGVTVREQLVVEFYAR